MNASLLNDLDFELVLFTSPLVTFDSIMRHISRFSSLVSGAISKEEIISMVRGDAKFMDQCDDLVAYIDTVKAGTYLHEASVRTAYEAFKGSSDTGSIARIAADHGINPSDLVSFFNKTVSHSALDGQAITDLFLNSSLGWKARVAKEESLIAALAPLLLRRNPRISGLKAWVA